MKDIYYFIAYAFQEKETLLNINGDILMKFSGNETVEEAFSYLRAMIEKTIGTKDYAITAFNKV